jgi:hypothetical protein
LFIAISLKKTCGNSWYFEVLKDSSILDNEFAVRSDRFISVSISKP